MQYSGWNNTGRRLLLPFARFVDSLMGLFGSIGRYTPVRGYFSGAQLISEGEIDGKILLETQELRSNDACSLNRIVGFNQDDAQPWPIFWAHTPMCTLAGKHLVWRDQKHRQCIEASFGYTKLMSVRNHPWVKDKVLNVPTLVEGNITSITSLWTSGTNYYHWTIDALSRLAVLDELPKDTKIIIPKSNSDFVSESLGLLGLTDRCLALESNHVICENYYFISPTAQTGFWNPFAYDWLRDSFSTYFNADRIGSKVFFTRKSCKRIPANIAEMEELFQKNGFQIVDAGKLSMSEQIALASSATCIAGLHGAAMTNLLWSKKKIPVLEIFESGYLNACYENIAIHNECSYRFIFCDSHDSLHTLDQWISELPS